MQKTYIRHILAISIVSGCLLFGGCKNTSAPADSPSSSAASQTATPTPSATPAPTPTNVEPSESVSSETPSAETRSLTLSVVNMCGIEIGMVAVIDPVTGEQVNLDSLANEESISMEANWPLSVKEFQWALYNSEGELCIEGKTDISAAETAAVLVLTGDGNVEKVEEIFQ